MFEVLFEFTVKHVQEDILVLVYHQVSGIVNTIRRRFTLENDIFIDCGECLPVLHLFGYAFKPVAQYIQHGNYHWNKKKAAWETKTEDQEGIPVRVEFQIYTGENDD